MRKGAAAGNRRGPARQPAAIPSLGSAGKNCRLVNTRHHFLCHPEGGGAGGRLPPGRDKGKVRKDALF